MSITLLEDGEASDTVTSTDERGALSKEHALRKLLRDLGSVLVAFSGGVDSTYLAYIANSELGESALCVTGESPSLSDHERLESERLARQLGLRREVIQTQELLDTNYAANDRNRCYFCKDELYEKLREVATVRNIEFVVDGSNLDDVGDYRPGRVAAAEHEIRSPLIEAGLTKADIRWLSQRVGLSTWDKPASPCLSSRIAYGIPVTIERLSAVERGEQILREMGFREFRVRHHDNLARLEISANEMENVLKRDVVNDLARRFRELGFTYVTLDLQGFRSGAMNEGLGKPSH